MRRKPPEMLFAWQLSKKLKFSNYQRLGNGTKSLVNILTSFKKMLDPSFRPKYYALKKHMAKTFYNRNSFNSFFSSTLNTRWNKKVLLNRLDQSLFWLDFIMQKFQPCYTYPSSRNPAMSCQKVYTASHLLITGLLLLFLSIRFQRGIHVAQRF